MFDWWRRRKAKRKGPIPVDIDPDVPPVVKIYSPRPGSAPRYCSCHQRVLRPGEPVLWVTLADPPGAVLMFCEENGEPQP